MTGRRFVGLSLVAVAFDAGLVALVRALLP